MISFFLNIVVIKVILGFLNKRYIFSVAKKPRKLLKNHEFDNLGLKTLNYLEVNKLFKKILK